MVKVGNTALQGRGVVKYVKHLLKKASKKQRKVEPKMVAAVMQAQQNRQLWVVGFRE